MDILFFAIITIFIFFKLRSELGKVDEEQKRESIKRFIKSSTNIKNSKSSSLGKVVNIKDIQGVESEPEIDLESQKILESLDVDLRSNVQEVLSKANLSAALFLKGANQAFEIILEGFSKGDYNSFKELLSKKIYDQFKGSIEDRKTNNHILSTIIIAVDESKIIEAKISGKFVAIVVSFKSQQINYITDQDGAVISGNKEEINSTIDVWTFKKDYTSKKPNWLVSSTS